MPGPSETPGGGRKYDLALAAAGLTADSTAAPRLTNETPPLPSSGNPTAPPPRPPPGAPTVRPPARRIIRPTPALDGLLASAADSMMLVTEPDGSTAFDIAIRDDVFDELACRVHLRDGHLSATFRVHDPNLRRLLEAEVGRLRASLADRGLVVDDIAVAETDD
jgi:hypothetical protein